MLIDVRVGARPIADAGASALASQLSRNMYDSIDTYWCQSGPPFEFPGQAH